MKQSIAIIGGGPAAIFCAAFLDTERFEVHIYEKNKALGRKFLVAGNGGFNLTHGEAIEQMIERYTPNHFLQAALSYFSNTDTRSFLASLGIPSFVGTSGRVFPEKGIKPITVLKTLEKLLTDKGVHIHYQHQWTGWHSDGSLRFGEKRIQADHYIFALGGASWKVTGSDASWASYFEKKGLKTMPFLPANCAYYCHWPADFINTHQGKPLKNISVSCSDKTQTGELVITQKGLEGNAIYPLSPQIQEQFNQNEKALIHIDFKPMFTKQKVLEKIQTAKGNRSKLLKNDLKLSAPSIQMIKNALDKDAFLNDQQLADSIKHFPLELYTSAPIDEAISTMGGISLQEVNAHFQLHQLPQHYCIGEMLDWTAPTGGYLLQACFSMGVFLAKYLNEGNEA